MASFLSKRTALVKPSPIQKLSRLAEECKAINLAEGFPDFPAPNYIKEAANAAISSDFNQYRHVEALCEAVAENFASMQNVKVDPSNVAICCGQSEAFAATILSVVDPNDEVLLLDPAYETYGAFISLAGGVPVYIGMEPPSWDLNMGKIKEKITKHTKAIVVNSPHNPTGKVFSIRELSEIAELCVSYNLLGITDEVYEHITFGDIRHVSLASFPGMLERTIVTSSLSKTYSVTGWRVGWAIAPFLISSAIKNVHVKMTDSAPAPFQEAAVTALKSSSSYYDALKQEYETRCKLVCSMLVAAGLELAFRPEGSFFAFAKLPETYKGSDLEYVQELVGKAGVIVVPGQGFFHADADERPEFHTRYIRVAFCKDIATLHSAAVAMVQMAKI